MDSAKLRRSRRGGLVPALLLCGWALAACAAGPDPERTTPALPPPLSAAGILAPVEGRADAELVRLHRLADEPAALLRRAWIYLQTGRVDEALELTNRLLYGNEGVAPAEEAMARFVRGQAWLAEGDDERGQYDLEQADRLALDPALKERIAAVLRPPQPEAAPEAAPALEFVARSAWQPAPPAPSRLDPMGRIFRVTIHHSAMAFSDRSAAEAAAEIRRIQHQHMRGRGYGDIGYHLLIDPAGRIWQGRDLRYQGAHARLDNNVGNLGICLLGNFVRGGQKPTPAQVAALRSLLTAIVEKYDIPPEQVKTHRQFVVTQCPGENLQVVVDRFVADLRRRRGAAVAGR